MPRHQIVVMGLLILTGVSILIGTGWGLVWDHQHHFLNGLWMMAMAVPFAISAPFVWWAGEAFRRFVHPTLYFAKDVTDMFWKKLFWLIGPQSVAMVISFLAFYMLGDPPSTEAAPSSSAGSVTQTGGGAMTAASDSAAQSVAPAPSAMARQPVEQTNAAPTPAVAQQFATGQPVDQSDSYVCYHGAESDPRTTAACNHIEARASQPLAPPATQQVAQADSALEGKRNNGTTDEAGDPEADAELRAQWQTAQKPADHTPQWCRREFALSCLPKSSRAVVFQDPKAANEAAWRDMHDGESTTQATKDAIEDGNTGVVARYCGILGSNDSSPLGKHLAAEKILSNPGMADVGCEILARSFR